MKGYKFKTVFCCKKGHFGKACKALYPRREVIDLGQYSAVKKIILARRAEHCIRDERLQVLDSILL